jgi:hypothetical protein
MIQELDDIILECDLPEHGLRRGDIGTVVLVHQGARATKWNLRPWTAKPWLLSRC